MFAASTAEAQPVRAGLFLHNSPLTLPSGLRLDQPTHERGTLNAGFGLDDAGGGVEVDHSVQPARVNQGRGRAELLAAHRMPAARGTDGAAGLADLPDDSGELVCRLNMDDAIDDGGIQL